MITFDLVAALAKAKRARSLFPGGHAVVRDRIRQLFITASDLISHQNRAEIHILDEEVFVNGYALRQESLEFAALVQEISSTEITGVSLRPGITEQELTILIDYLVEIAHEPEREKQLDTELQERGVAHVSLSRILPVDFLAQQIAVPGGFSEGTTGYHEAVSKLEGILKDIRSGGTLDLEITKDIVSQLVAETDKEQVSIAGVLRIKQYDDCTFRHSVNVALLALLIGRRLGLEEAALGALGEASLLHDVGKIMIPKEIIAKDGRLTPSEWEIVQRHPFIGAETLVSVPGLHPMTPCVALEHHSRFDGNGYPRLTIDHTDHFATHIIAICDFYDALTTLRSYREPMAPHQVVPLLLQGMGSQFHPALVKLFVSEIGFYPIGTMVETSLGEVAIVSQVNREQPRHPVITLLASANDNHTNALNTAEKDAHGNYLRTIVRALKS